MAAEDPPRVWDGEIQVGGEPDYPYGHPLHGYTSGNNRRAQDSDRDRARSLIWEDKQLTAGDKVTYSILARWPRHGVIGSNSGIVAEINPTPYAPGPRFTTEENPGDWIKVSLIRTINGNDPDEAAREAVAGGGGQQLLDTLQRAGQLDMEDMLFGILVASLVLSGISLLGLALACARPRSWARRGATASGQRGTHGVKKSGSKDGPTFVIAAQRQKIA